MSSDATPPTTSRGRGRGRSRGGLGKFLRARGRRGGGRPAEFRERLVLDGEEPEELDEEEAAERTARYTRRQLGSNADRYAEAEPELGSDGVLFRFLASAFVVEGVRRNTGEPIVEPEVDLSSFLERQRISDEKTPSVVSELGGQVDDEDDIDHSLDHITSAANRKRQQATSRKGKVEAVEWDEELESMAREKAAAEATWDLKDRFRAKSEKLKNRPLVNVKERKGGTTLTEAPALPNSDPPKDPKAEMQDYLDDLLG